MACSHCLSTSVSKRKTSNFHWTSNLIMTDSRINFDSQKREYYRFYKRMALFPIRKQGHFVFLVETGES